MKGVVAIFGLVVLSAAVVAGVVGVLWSRNEAITATRVDPTPIWAAVTPAPDMLVESATFAVHRSPRAIVPAGAWSGTITAVGVEVGDVLAPSGAAPITVAGLARPWMVSASPLYRPIGKGLSGDDVDALAAYLTTLGFVLDRSNGDPVDATMVGAVRAWAALSGFGHRATAFESDWVTWLPEPLVGEVVTAVDVLAGHVAPGLGGDFIAVGERPTSVTRTVDAAGPPEVVIEGIRDRIVLGDQEFDFDGQNLADPALEHLAATLAPDQNEFSTLIQHVLPADAVTIPASALVPASNDFCVVVSAQADGGSPRAAHVHPLGATSGMAVVVLDAPYVLINPVTAIDACA